MAEVKNVGPLFKVTCTEYEAGWGQRPMGVKYFTTEAEAKKFCEDYASGDYECFYRASYTRVA